MQCPSKFYSWHAPLSTGQSTEIRETKHYPSKFYSWLAPFSTGNPKGQGTKLHNNLLRSMQCPSKFYSWQAPLSTGQSTEIRETKHSPSKFYSWLAPFSTRQRTKIHDNLLRYKALPLEILLVACTTFNRAPKKAKHLDLRSSK